MAPLTTGMIKAILQEISQQRAGRGRYARGGGPLAGITYNGASGGVISDYVDPGPGTRYRAHIFTSSGTFTVTDPTLTSVDYLVVAGGGGGANPSQGQNRIAGSGAGGMLTGSAFPVSPGPYTIAVGNGGAGNGPTPNNGGPSSFGPTITATGGGGAGHSDPAPTSIGSPGGSGGGGWYVGPGAGGSGIPGQGFAGSPGFSSPEYGGGGGGAGGAGQRRFGGAGAPNVYAYGPTNPVTYAAGGESSDHPAIDRTANGTTSTGNGGSGRGSGGSGIVVVRYTLPASTGTARATGGAISFYDGKTIHTFTSSGTFATTPNWTAANVEYVVIGGGGSGGGKIYVSAGGGAGSYRTGTTPIGAHPVSTTIQVGAGGVVSSLYSGGSGTESYFGIPITAPGGGYGATYPDPGIGGPGGSGGGGAAASAPGAGGPATGAPFPGTIGATPAAGWGHNGGSSNANEPAYGAGGGGGAGGVGSNGTPTLGGNGGVGIQLPATFRNPSSTVGAPGPTSPPFSGADTSGKYWVAGGGGGSTYPTGTPGSSGGAGGGGAGSAGANGGDGVVNTGSGGGGSEREVGPATQSGRGGSGIVIIAYPT